MLNSEELRDISRKSNDVLAELGEQVSWVQRDVTEDKLYCVYDAADPELIAEHARRGGFLCDRIHLVTATIAPEAGT